MALSGIALMRLKKELEMLHIDPCPGVSAWIEDEDPRELVAGALPSLPNVCCIF